MSEYEKMFKDKEFCRNEILEARKLFGNINATFEQYDNLIKGLMIMFIHCPEELVVTVRATIQEAEKRQFHQVNRMLAAL